MEKIEVTRGVYLLNVPEVDLSILCACPPDVIKHLMKRGLISQRPQAGVFWENGPNAILLSDLPLQGGKFANLAEFPILQMFYRQGMIVPGHPGNTGRKPVVIGLASQILALNEYLFRGTYGLKDIKEIQAAGVSDEFAQEILRIKMAFAFNKIRDSEELLEQYATDQGAVEIRPGLTVAREGINRYVFALGDKRIEVDLNLREGESYDTPVTLGFHRVYREYFSVVHIGEGDGWDPHRPCMSSVVVFQGKVFLIDTGPNILDSLTALGVSVNEVAGIFHTHAHDDHFAGLTSLVRTDHRIRYFATPLVRATVMKKLAAIMGLPEKRFLRSFEIHDLHHNEWNNIAGLEVMPVFSPHPVETNILFFRTMWESGYKTYAHLADIASRKVLDDMLLAAPNHTEVSSKFHNAFTYHLTRPVDLKKIDIGGGMIHGEARDYDKDRSKKIVLAHIARDLTPAEKEIGSNATFAMEDNLIHAQRDYVRDQAERYLHSFFPKAAKHDIDMLVNCPIHRLNMGYIIQKKGTPSANVYLIINGVVEVVRAETGLVHMLSAGSIIGEWNVLGGDLEEQTYRARSYITVLQIPAQLYTTFIQRNADFDEVKRICEVTLFLQTTPLFGEMVSSPVLHNLARGLKTGSYPKGAVVEQGDDSPVILLRGGSMEIFMEDKLVDRIEPGGFFGEEAVLASGTLARAVAASDCDCFLISGGLVRNIPIVEWKMLEVYERRLTAFGSQLA